MASDNREPVTLTGDDKMTASLITTAEQNKMVTAFCTVAEAAKQLGRSESAVRKHAKKLGVKKIKGRGISGFILFDAYPVPVTVAYCE
jgi:predicted transcriptional regulator